MKIAQVVCVYPPYAGGIGNSALRLQKTISKKHESFVFTTEKNKETKNHQENNIIYLKTFLKLGHGAILFSLIKKLKKFDLIYFHYPFFGTAIIIYLFKIFNPKKRLIIHYHMDVRHKNIFFKILSWPEKIIRKSLFQKSEKIISASLDYIKNSEIKNIYQKSPDKFFEIPFSVDTNKFKPIKYEKKENNILFVGGLDKAHYFKGVNILIKAFASINPPDYKLLIIGQGELKKEYQKLAEESNISEKVIFLGKLKLKELIENYQKAKTLVLASINNNEAFGIVLIEAMACGTPVIASNLPGVRSVFENNKSGLLIKTKDIDSLKEKLKIIINEEERTKKMSKEARKLIEKKYSKEIIDSKILKLL
jgi:glycosyltransferase involved in cell wall biosynthesis